MTRTPRRMNSMLNSLGDFDEGYGNGPYYPDFPTVFDAPNTSIYNQTYFPDFPLATDAPGTSVQQPLVLDSLPTSFSAADVGKIIKVGAQLYQAQQARNAQGQLYYAARPFTSQIQTPLGPMSPLMLAILAGAAFLALK